MSLVPDGFDPPPGPQDRRFRLEPLSEAHNVSDRPAWTTSIGHIRRTPGFAGRSWPVRAMSPEDNLVDIRRHAADFAARTGFTYTVLDPGRGDVIGCVYMYPSRRQGFDVDVRSWVRADRAELDAPLHEVVRRWLSTSWPWAHRDYATKE